MKDSVAHAEALNGLAYHKQIQFSTPPGWHLQPWLYLSALQFPQLYCTMRSTLRKLASNHRSPARLVNSTPDDSDRVLTAVPHASHDFSVLYSVLGSMYSVDTTINWAGLHLILHDHFCARIGYNMR
jgi:hypothetical protein